MNVVEITEKWNANVSDLICTGQRSFLYMADGNYPSTPTLITCPVIGDIFGKSGDDIAGYASPWNTMYCRKIRTEILKNTANNKIITCFFSNEPWDRTGALGGISNYADLPKESSIAGEYQQIGTDNKWKWKSDSVDTIQPLYKRIGITNFNVIKVLASPEEDQTNAVTKLSNYINNAILPLSGKINSATFMGFSAGTVLLEGAKIDMTMDHMSCPSYTVTLKCAVRTVTYVSGADNDGWNYVLKINGTNAGTWAKPKNKATNNYLFTSADFDPLFV